MSTGLSTAFAALILGALETGTASLASKWIQLHTGDPGASGTTFVSDEDTRKEIEWGTPADGAVAVTNSPEWTGWSAGAEVLNYLSVWSTITAGLFRFSAALSTPRSVNDGDTVRLNSLTFAFVPIAADEESSSA